MNRGLAFGTAVLLIINVSSCRKVPDPPSPDDTTLFAACIIPGTSTSLDIVTFNVEGFPKAGYTSVTALAALLKTIDPDAVALQEVASEADFNRLVKLMPGWTGIFYPIDNDDWNLAYLFKNSEIEVSQGSAGILFEDDFFAFPRPPFEIMVSHKPSGTDLYLINLHLKCCGGTDNESSRRSASRQLKEYLDVQRSEDAVVMLGDYNDEIASENEGENPFLNFINDPEGYLFSDLAIAKGSALWWSYPSWPSHLDHILITDELSRNIDTTMVVKASPCYPDYAEVLSDHRPVMVRIVR
ncbi:MAG: endonuclease/exonuclease/phosphatase family protein [Bacteroidales bacterium]|jgi:endonuclease/exonuclease/phosphatase family metal-dependent hydrolase|nr:endonuclease/exonuclease/phosphatase family protein [Bacteroidales bacterium]